MKKTMPFLLLIGMLVACRHQTNNSQDVSSKDLRETLIRANKKITESESDKIDKYIKRRKWKMTQTGTGLRYFIYRNGSGELATEGQYATVSYKITLLDGTVCYASEENEPRRFLIGRDHVESGLHEGVTYMRVGDGAMFILPSHLAHGLTGDRNKIPPRSVLVMDIRLLALD